eukprot:2995292-Pleurochrysis_carterae.AAC.1
MGRVLRRTCSFDKQLPCDEWIMNSIKVWLAAGYGLKRVRIGNSSAFDVPFKTCFEAANSSCVLLSDGGTPVPKTRSFEGWR